jgi:long-chain acyl-CoA synthetase
MDDPAQPGEPGRVGLAIPGIEMKAGDSDRNSGARPQYFSGYWKRPEETARVLQRGWLHSGDQEK